MLLSKFDSAVSFCSCGACMGCIGKLLKGSCSNVVLVV